MRGWIWDRLRRASPYKLRRWIKVQPWFLPVSKRLFGNTVYSDSYFEDMERIEARSTRHMADWIAERLAPRAIVDLGCGPGLLLRELKERGVDVYGVDLSPAAIRRVHDKGLDADLHDLTTGAPLPRGGAWDLAISTEVAEHLEPEHADAFLDTLAGAADRIYLTAAEPIPGQGPGLYHFNEQPNDYWIERLERRGFALDEDATADARRVFAEHRIADYLARPMIFARRS